MFGRLLELPNVSGRLFSAIIFAMLLFSIYGPTGDFKQILGDGKDLTCRYQSYFISGVSSISSDWFVYRQQFESPHIIFRLSKNHSSSCVDELSRYCVAHQTGSENVIRYFVGPSFLLIGIPLKFRVAL
jgi:hypothetical protein